MKKRESGFRRVTICIPAKLWPWVLRSSKKGEFAGNMSSFFRNALLAYKRTLEG